MFVFLDCRLLCADMLYVHVTYTTTMKWSGSLADHQRIISGSQNKQQSHNISADWFVKTIYERHISYAETIKINKQCKERERERGEKFYYSKGSIMRVVVVVVLLLLDMNAYKTHYH